MASAFLLALGCADLAALNLVLAPRLRGAGRVVIAAEAAAGETCPSSAPPGRASPAPPAPAASPPARPPTSPPTGEVGGAAAQPTQAAPDVVFEFGEVRVPGSAAAAVRRVADELRAHGDRRLFVRGHADRLGLSGSNVALSWKRAEAVRALLAAYGAPLDRVALEAVGDAEPRDPTESPTGWARNRRVQLLWR